jgi:uncharacterized protein YbjT (DUF2867 family)
MRAASAAGFRARGMTRDAARARRAHPSFAWVEADARDAAKVAAAMRDVSYVVCAIGAPAFDGPDAPQFVDYLGVANVVDAAARKNVRHFVLISSGSAGPHREPRQTPRLNYVLLWKTLGENHLKASGLPYTIIGPAGLTPEPAGAKGLVAIPRERYESSLVARTDVARVALDALRNPAAADKSFALVNASGASAEAWRRQLEQLPTDTADLGAIENLAWIAGHWTRADAGATADEIWLPADGGVMLGTSRSVPANGRRSLEYMRIEERGDGVIFVASPIGQASAEFKLTTAGKRRATFENRAHDFPQQITYARDGDKLTATLAGVEKGVARQMVLSLRLQTALRAPHVAP